MIWLLPHPLLPIFPASKLDPAATHRKTEEERQLADERGEKGGGRSQIIRRRESLVFYKSFNTLWRNNIDQKL
jgi:hypothetical protein